MILLNNYKNDLTAILIISAFWIGIFAFSGTFTSGYHFIDDYEIISMDSKLKSSPVTYVAKRYILPDLERRFRPFWALHRVMEVKIFGRDFRLWAVYTGLLCIFTSLFLYKFAVITGYSFMQSLLFTFLTLAGQSSVIWYQYADSENIGMFFLSLSIFLLAKCIYGDRHRFFYKSGFIVSIIITALCKESFTVILPAVIFLYLWLYSAKNKQSLAQSFKKNLSAVLIPLFACAVCLVVILFIIGTAKTGYAGVDEKLFDSGIILNFFPAILNFKIFILILSGIIIFTGSKIFKSNFNDDKNAGETHKSGLLNLSIFFLLIVIPQYILYYKSGIHSRYYLPVMLGFSFSSVYLLKLIFDSKFTSVITKYFFLSLTVLLILYEIFTYTIPDLIGFDKERRATTGLLNFIEKNTGKESSVLTVMDPVHHWGYGKSFFVYMNNSNGSRNLSFKFIKLDTMIYPYNDSALYKNTEAYTGRYFGSYLFDSVNNTGNFDFINVFPGLENKFLKDNPDWFNKENFEKKEFGEFIVYYKKFPE